MLTACERRLITFYLANAASRLHHQDREASELAGWIADRDNRVAFGTGRRRPRLRHPDPDPEEGMSKGKLVRLEAALREEYAKVRRARLDRTARRLQALGETTGLSRTDLDILELLLRYRTQPIIESMVDDIFGRATRCITPFNLKGLALPSLLGASARAIHGRLREDAPLVRSGLVSVDSDGDLNVVGRLNRLVTAPGGARLDVNRLLFRAASPSELRWSDFDHVARDRDHVADVLRGALEAGATGVNILLYGPPGTGKTELCKVLAEHLGMTLYSVGESDEEGGEPLRGERLQELRLAQRLLGGDRRSLLLFDEMDDLLSAAWPDFDSFGLSFTSRSRNGGSRVFMHRLLEQAPVPTLWTMNDARHVNPAILRRMMFALELRRPTPRVRARIWMRQLERHGIEARTCEALSLATEFESAPGVAAGATAAAALSGGGIASVRHGVQSLSRVLGGEKPPQGPQIRFDLGLIRIRGDSDSVELAEQLVRSNEPRFSMCLQGPPGTGKSAFVRYLAEHLGLEVVQKRASDLLSMWVGATERHIADAFAEARDTGSFLVFDEADSLLADRRLAERSWEVSQVNEMLTWMESHPLPFACTTNFGQHLDPATLRRFVFKVTLDYLAPAQIAAAFRSYFALTPPAGLANLVALAPGDFAVVRRKAEILGRLQDPGALATMLRAECDAKPDRPRAIGFHA